jgi:hypothetical protein
MTTLPSFSARHWIDTNCRGGHALKGESVAVVSGFTLMWSIFEGAVCDNQARIPVFKKRANEIGHRGTLPAAIEDGVRFWTQRYVTEAGFNQLFEQLRFRPPDCRERVEAVLRGEKNDPESQVLAVLIVIYRLRNNLFHGLKGIEILNDQVPNLIVACQVLAAIVEASRALMILTKDAA